MTSQNRVLQRPSSNKVIKRRSTQIQEIPLILPVATVRGAAEIAIKTIPPLDPTPGPDPTAGFVEYLRWMRSPSDPSSKDGTKIQLLTTAERGNYTERLKSLTERIRQIAGEQNCFQVTCPWRIRVVATAVQKLCSCRSSITWEFPIFPPALCAA